MMPRINVGTITLTTLFCFAFSNGHGAAATCTYQDRMYTAGAQFCSCPMLREAAKDELSNKENVGFTILSHLLECVQESGKLSWKVEVAGCGKTTFEGKDVTASLPTATSFFESTAKRHCAIVPDEVKKD